MPALPQGNQPTQPEYDPSLFRQCEDGGHVPWAASATTCHCGFRKFAVSRRKQGDIERMRREIIETPASLAEVPEEGETDPLRGEQGEGARCTCGHTRDEHPCDQRGSECSCRLFWPADAEEHPIEDAVVTAAEFITRLNIRATATPDVREAAAIEKLIHFVGAPPRVVPAQSLTDLRQRLGELADEWEREADNCVRAARNYKANSGVEDLWNIGAEDAYRLNVSALRSLNTPGESE